MFLSFGYGSCLQDGEFPKTNIDSRDESSYYKAYPLLLMWPTRREFCHK